MWVGRWDRGQGREQSVARGEPRLTEWRWSWCGKEIRRILKMKNILFLGFS
jgi:hypothetical protein